MFLYLHIVSGSRKEPSVYTHYLYDAAGNRVKKYTRTAGGNWETITYLDGLIEYREDQDSNLQSINHVMDDSKRIATIREGNNFGDTTPAIKYNLDDHLGSSNVLVDDSGTLVNQEEYYPFGETSFGAYAKKRYHFCGKEKDEESGMYYYGARYYSHWLCRFISVDPLAGKYPFYTPYQYAGNKPINKLDRDGLEETGSSPQQPADSSNTGGENSITPDSTTTTDSKDTVAVPPPTDSKSTPDTTQNAKTKPAPTQRKENTIPLHKVTGVKIDMSFDRGKGAGMQSTDYLNTEVIKNKIHLATDAKPTSNSNIEPIGNVIDSKYFKGQAPGSKNCLDVCRDILKSIGIKQPDIKSKAIQMVVEKAGEMTVLPTAAQGVNMINNSLENGKPIIVGVSYKPGDTGNTDKTTDHWIIITGRGVDSDGKIYYTFFDVGTRTAKGYSPSNKLYLNNDNSLTGSKPYGTKPLIYTVTQVRPNQ